MKSQESEEIEKYKNNDAILTERFCVCNNLDKIGDFVNAALAGFPKNQSPFLGLPKRLLKRYM